jgi:hypothetical protein
VQRRRFPTMPILSFHLWCGNTSGAAIFCRSQAKYGE